MRFCFGRFDMKDKNEYGTMLNFDAKIVRPRCSITCAKYNYLKKENAGKVQVRCDKCKDRRFCAQQV